MQLMEGSEISLQWNHPNADDDVGYGREAHHQPQLHEFYHPLHSEPTLQIGYVKIARFSFSFQHI